MSYVIYFDTSRQFLIRGSRDRRFTMGHTSHLDEVEVFPTLDDLTQFLEDYKHYFDDKHSSIDVTIHRFPHKTYMTMLHQSVTPILIESLTMDEAIIVSILKS